MVLEKIMRRTEIINRVKIQNAGKSINIVHIYAYNNNIIKKGEIYQKPKSLVVWEGRPDFSFLFKS